MENLKRWGWIAGGILVVLAVAWGILKPARVIETTITSKSEVLAWGRVESLQAENQMLRISKTETEKKLARASELNKNVNTHREYYPDGKLKSEDIIDLSRYVKNSDSSETSTTSVTEALLQQIAELKKEIGSLQLKTSESKKTDTQYQSDWAVTGTMTIPLAIPLVPKFDDVMLYRRILGPGYLGAGGGPEGAKVSVLMIF